MKIAILGAGGFIGQAVAARCLAAGHTVTCISRGRPTMGVGDATWIEGDRGEPNHIADILRAQRCDSVIDMIAYSETDTSALLEAIGRQIGRYVLISSADVYRNYGRLHRQETGEPDAGPLDETAPLRTGRYPYRGETPRAADDPHLWMDDYDKILVEEIARKTASDWSICRLPMVYGPGDPQMRFAWAYTPMLAETSRIELPGSWLDWAVTYGHVETVATAIVHVATHPHGARRVFNITEDESPTSHAVWVRRFADLIQWTGDVVRTDDEDHPIAQATSALDLSIHLRVSGSELRQATGFVSPLTIDQALQMLLPS